MKDLVELWREGNSSPDEQRIEIGKEWWRRAVDQCLQIGCIRHTLSNYGIYCASTKLGNVPGRIFNSVNTYPMCNAWPMTFYHK